MTTSLNIYTHNSAAWDRLAQQQCPWSQAVSSETVNAAKQGEWSLYLTPSPVPRAWLGDVCGLRVLCLASGGGQQAPILAAAGAQVTVLDASAEQLAQDRLVAERDALDMTLVQGDMRDLSIFAAASFDLIVHPISNQYVPDIQPVWQECYRVLANGGALLSSFFNPVIFIAEREADAQTDTLHLRYPVPYSDLTHLSEAVRARKIQDGEPFMFGHGLSAQLGGQMAAGFVLAGLFEEWHPAPRMPIERFIPSFIATRALKL